MIKTMLLQYFLFLNCYLNSINWEHLLCIILIFFSLLLNSKTRTPMETYENASTPTSSLNQTPRKPKEPKHLARAGQLHPIRPWPANHLPPQRVPAVSPANHVSAPVPPANWMQPLHPLPQDNTAGPALYTNSSWETVAQRTHRLHPSSPSPRV